MEANELRYSNYDLWKDWGGMGKGAIWPRYPFDSLDQRSDLQSASETVKAADRTTVVLREPWRGGIPNFA